MNFLFGSSKFNNSHQIGDDASDKTQQNVQNVDHANYMTTNYMYNNTIGGAMGTALEQPYFYVRGTNGLALEGSNIKESNELTIGSQLLRSKEKLNLRERQYTSVPFMGRGKVDPDVESALMQSNELPEKKSDVGLSEKDFTDVNNYPLIDSVHNGIANPSNAVESNAMEGWVRGGVASRGLSQDNLV